MKQAGMTWNKMEWTWMTLESNKVKWDEMKWTQWNEMSMSTEFKKYWKKMNGNEIALLK